MWQLDYIQQTEAGVQGGRWFPCHQGELFSSAALWCLSSVDGSFWSVQGVRYYWSHDWDWLRGLVYNLSFRCCDLSVFCSGTLKRTLPGGLKQQQSSFYNKAGQSLPDSAPPPCLQPDLCLAGKKWERLFCRSTKPRKCCLLSVKWCTNALKKMEPQMLMSLCFHCIFLHFKCLISSSSTRVCCQ